MGRSIILVNLVHGLTSDLQKLTKVKDSLWIKYKPGLPEARANFSSGLVSPGFVNPNFDLVQDSGLTSPGLKLSLD